MHGNNFNSLNFHHGGYQDPFADLQQSLGAGGIFSQTLKQMNQDMYANAARDRADQEFQWRKEDRQRQEDEQKNATALRNALFDARTTGKDGIGNDLFSGEVAKTNGGLDMFIDPSNTKYGNLSTNQAAIDAIKAQAADPKYKDNVDLQNFLKAANSDKGFDSQFNGDYSSSSKAAMLHGAYKALGMSDADAMKNASLALGNSNIVSDTLKANSKLNTFADDLQSQVIHNPSLRKTDLDVVSDLIAGMPKEKVTDNLLKSWENLDAAQTAAIKSKKDEINRLKIEQGRNADSEQQKQLELQLKAMEEKQAIAALKVKGDTASLNAAGLGTTTTQYDPNKDYYSLAAKAANAAIAGYGAAALKAENAAVVQQARDYADKLIANGIRPELLQSRIGAFLKYDGDVKDGKLTAVKSTANMLSIKDSDKVDPSAYQQRSNLSQADQTLAKQIYDAELNGHMDKLAMLQKIAASGGNAANAISSQLANLERSSQQAASAEAYNAGKQLAVDHGWGDPDPIVAQKPATLDIGSTGNGTKGGSKVQYGNQSYDNNVAGRVAQSVGLSPFAARMIHDGEDVRNGTEYQMYNDTKRVNGKIVPRPSVASLDFEEVKRRAAAQGIHVAFIPNGDLSKMQGPAGEKVRAIVDELRGEQYKIAMGAGNRIASSFFNGDQSMSDVFTNFAYQYGANSSVLNKTASKIALNLSSGNVQGAIDEVTDHSYGKYANRAKNLVVAIIDYANRNGIDTSKINLNDKLFKGSNMTTADAIRDYNLRLAKVNGNKDLSQAEKDAIIGGMHTGYSSYGLQWHNTGETQPVDKKKLQDNLRFNSNEVVGNKIDALLKKDNTYNIGNRVASFVSNVATFGDPTPMSFSDKTLVGVNNVLQNSGVFNKDDTVADKIAKVQDYRDNGSGKYLESSGAKDAIDYWLHYSKMQNSQNYRNEYAAEQRDAALSGALASTIPLGAVEGGLLKGASSVVSEMTAADIAAIRAELASAKTAKEVKSLLKVYKKQYPDQIDNITKLYELNKQRLVRPMTN